MKICASTPLTKAFLTHLKIFEGTLPYYQWKTFEALLIGRLLLHVPTPRRIHREIISGCSIATWYRYIKHIAETPFNFGDYVCQMYKNGQLRINRTGVFIIDGHVIPHLGKKMEGVSLAYSSAEKKPILGLETEMAHYWSPSVQFPVDFRIFLAQTDLCIQRQKAIFKTKNELVRDIVAKLMVNYPETKEFVIDAGLGVKETLKLIQKEHKFFATRPKKNFNVTFAHHKQSVSELFDTIQSNEFQTTNVENPKTKVVKTYSTAIRDVFISGLGTQRLVFIDISTIPSEELQDTAPSQELVSPSKKKFRVFMSNKLTLSAGEILSLYSIRWAIETAFRDANQNMGLSECKFCQIAYHQLFLTITCLEYIFLIWAKDHPFLMNYGNVQTSMGELKQAFVYYCQNEFIDYFMKLQDETSCPEELACLKMSIYQ
jgi:hypothetical protein